MKCIFPAINTKVFSKAIQSLAKIGSELYIEATIKSFSIKTLNSTKSAFAVFKFFPSFFTNYSLSSCANLNKCKISLKACIAVFKSMRNVEHCKIFINPDDYKLVVQLKCRLETVKTHWISIIDVETLQATYEKQNAHNKIVGTYKLYAEICHNFQMNEEEITFEANADKLVVKNYVEGTNIDRRFMRSQLTLKADEFEKYSIEEETSLTFCLKEFRAMLNFAESCNLSMLVHFETAGKPIVFVLENLETFESNLVMSTLSPEDLSMDRDNTHFIPIKSIYQESFIRKRNDEQLKITHKKAKLETNFSVVVNTECNNMELKSVEQVRQNPSTEFQLSSVHLQSNMLEHDRSFKGSKIDKEEKNSEISVIFKNTEVTEHQNSMYTSLTSSRKKEVVFHRCFEITNPTDFFSQNQVLARNSDTEE